MTRPITAPAPARRLLSIVAGLALLVGVAACGGGDDGGGSDDAGAPTTAAARAGAEEGGRPPCDQEPTLEEVEATPVEGVDHDLDLTSFDGTTIRIHWFPTDGAGGEPAPTVLMGPGWSLPGDTSTDGAVLFGALGIGPLNDAGYNVLTWDPRGFGASGGTATVNAPDAEGRDVQALLDWVALQPEAALDGEGDPRVGMVGFSYGGGIQLTVAAQDCRVDALVPGLAWHSLETSLYKAGTVKAGWAGLLVDVAAAGDLDPHITSATASGLADGTLSDEDRAWFASRGPGDAVDRITAPTLLVGGTVDTLFTLDEVLTVHRSLRDRSVPVAMLWFCGGHGVCLTADGAPERVTEASFAWLDRWLRDDGDADEPAVLDLVDQDGTRWVADDGPTPGDVRPAVVVGDGGTLALADGGSGPAAIGPEVDDPLAGVVAGITPGPAEAAVEVTVAPAEPGLVVGAPRLRFTYRGEAPEGTAPTRVFAQLVDEATATVVGNQVTPVPVVLDGEERTAEVDLEVIAHHLEEGATLTLQIVATTVTYATPRLGGEVAVSAVEVDLPTSAGATRG